MYHSAYAGYTHSKEFTFSGEGLVQTGLRETAEEVLIMTNEAKPKLIVPNDSKEYTIESAKRIGIDIDKVKPMFIDVEELEPSDELEVYWENGELIYKVKAFLDIIRESQTSINSLQIRKLPFSSEEVVPVDAEGTPKKDGGWNWFNRESYMIPISSIENRPFGSILENPRVYQTRIVNGIPEVYTPEYNPPYLGPGIELVLKDGSSLPGIRAPVEVTHPHLFAPENLLATVLDGLGVGGYKGRKVHIEKWKEECMLNKIPLLPHSVLKKK